MQGCAPAAVVCWAAEAPLHCFADRHVLILDERRKADSLHSCTSAGLLANG